MNDLVLLSQLPNTPLSADFCVSVRQSFPNIFCSNILWLVLLTILDSKELGEGGRRRSSGRSHGQICGTPMATTSVFWSRLSMTPWQTQQTYTPGARMNTGWLSSAPDWQLRVGLGKQLKVPEHITRTRLHTDLIIYSNVTK